MDTQQLNGGQLAAALAPPRLEDIRADRLWTDYDTEADILTVYLAPQPLPSVAHYMNDYLMVLTPLDSNAVIGFQVEGWERDYVPTQPKLAAWWPAFKRSLNEQAGDGATLTIMTVVWLFESLFQADSRQQVVLVTA